MHKVYLSLGSNIDTRKNIRFAITQLQENFSALEMSPVYESEAVGFEGDNFVNLVVGLSTELSLSKLSQALRVIEDSAGRDRSLPRFSSRTLDIDILTYDNCVGNFDGIELPRDEIQKNAFVLLPLSELTPNSCHPELGVTYISLWQGFDREKQRLWRIEL